MPVLHLRRGNFIHNANHPFARDFNWNLPLDVLPIGRWIKSFYLIQSPLQRPRNGVDLAYNSASRYPCSCAAQYKTRIGSKVVQRAPNGTTTNKARSRRELSDVVGTPFSQRAIDKDMALTGVHDLHFRRSGLTCSGSISWAPVYRDCQFQVVIQIVRRRLPWRANESFTAIHTNFSAIKTDLRHSWNRKIVSGDTVLVNCSAASHEHSRALEPVNHAVLRGGTAMRRAKKNNNPE